MQGLGKTVTTIALLVSNHVEPEREWGRVTADLSAPKRKRIKWGQHKPAAEEAPATPATESGIQPTAGDRSGTGLAAKESQGAGAGSEPEAAQAPASPATDAGPKAKACLCSSTHLQRVGAPLAEFRR